MFIYKGPALIKAILFLVLFTRLVHSSPTLAQALTIRTSHKIQLINRKETLLVDLNFHNAGQDSILIWTQSWRVIFLKDSSNTFGGYPFMGGTVNYLIIKGDTSQLERQIQSQPELQYTSMGNISYPCLKRLLPNESFRVCLLLEDPVLLLYAKKNPLYLYNLYV